MLLQTTLLLVLAAVATCAAPAPPIWPERFSVQYYTKVQDYGPTWKKPGKMFYNHSLKAMKADYYTWCLPLFDDPVTLKMDWNFTCSFLLTSVHAYFVTPKRNPVTNTTCCIFENDLPPPPPEWLKFCNYSGIETVSGKSCQKWWFYDSPDLYYGYWNTVVEPRIPVKFLGLSALNVTTLDYYNYVPFDKHVKPEIFEIPKDCNNQCAPVGNRMRPFGPFGF